MPTTHWTMLVGCIAIAGIPPLAGFFSKDEILFSAYRIQGYGQIVWAVGIVAAALTAFYMFRLYFMTFAGEFRGTEEQAHHLHESPASMTVPLMVLAAGSVVTGFLGLPKVWGGSFLEGFLEPSFETSKEALAEAFRNALEGSSLELSLMAGSVVVALGGIGVAVLLYRERSELPARIARTFSWLYETLLHKYYVDELYDRVFVRGLTLGLGNTFFATDRYVFDGGGGEVKAGGGVNGVAWAVRDVFARGSGLFDRFGVDGLVNLVALILDNLSYAFRALQDGLVQNYALFMLIGFILMFAMRWWVL
jgi:NADH-quinone oxidoreductase subunit L